MFAPLAGVICVVILAQSALLLDDRSSLVVPDVSRVFCYSTQSCHSCQDSLFP
jgi:hypothetical protein